MTVIKRKLLQILWTTYCTYAKLDLLPNTSTPDKTMWQKWHSNQCAKFSLTSYVLLAFTQPKAGQKVEPLNWNQEHKSVRYGPPSKATGHTPRPARNWPVPLSDLRPLRRQRANSDCRPACIARGDFLEIGHFALYSEFLHIKGRNFPDVFYPFTSTYDPYEPWTASWKSARTFF